MRQASKKRIPLSGIAVLVFATIILFPLYLVVINSFKSLGEITLNVASLPQSWTLDNYVRAWERTDLPRSFLNSLIVTVGANIGTVLIAAMAAYRIARSPSGFTSKCYTLFIGAMIVPFHVVIIPLTVVLKSIHLGGTLFGLILVYWGLATPTGVFMYCGFMKTVPKHIEEAALIDGCSPLRVFFGIALPLLKPITFTIIIMNTFWFWNDFLLPLLVVSTGPGKTVPIAINSLMDQYIMQWDLALPALVMAMVPALVAFLLMQKNIVGGLSAGAVKG